MARYETYRSNAAEAPLMRKWIFRALAASLMIHLGLFVFFQSKRLQNFGMRSVDQLTPSRFVLKQVTIDPKTLQDPDEVKTTLKDKPKAVQKIDVPVEKIQPSEISVTPQNPEIVSPILNDKPQMTAVNTDLVAKIEASHRPHIRCFVERVSNLKRGHGVDEFGREGFGNRSLENDSLGGNADLA